MHKFYQTYVRKFLFVEGAPEAATPAPAPETAAPSTAPEAAPEAAPSGEDLAEVKDFREKREKFQNLQLSEEEFDKALEEAEAKLDEMDTKEARALRRQLNKEYRQSLRTKERALKEAKKKKADELRSHLEGSYRDATGFELTKEERAEFERASNKTEFLRELAMKKNKEHQRDKQVDYYNKNIDKSGTTAMFSDSGTLDIVAEAINKQSDEELGRPTTEDEISATLAGIGDVLYLSSKDTELRDKWHTVVTDQAREGGFFTDKGFYYFEIMEAGNKMLEAGSPIDLGGMHNYMRTDVPVFMKTNQECCWARGWVMGCLITAGSSKDLSIDQQREYQDYVKTTVKSVGDKINSESGLLTPLRIPEDKAKELYHTIKGELLTPYWWKQTKTAEGEIDKKFGMEGLKESYDAAEAKYKKALDDGFEPSTELSVTHETLSDLDGEFEFYHKAAIKEFSDMIDKELKDFDADAKRRKELAEVYDRYSKETFNVPDEFKDVQDIKNAILVYNTEIKREYERAKPMIFYKPVDFGESLGRYKEATQKGIDASVEEIRSVTEFREKAKAYKEAALKYKEAASKLQEIANAKKPEEDYAKFDAQLLETEKLQEAAHESGEIAKSAPFPKTLDTGAARTIFQEGAKTKDEGNEIIESGQRIMEELNKTVVQPVANEFFKYIKDNDPTPDKQLAKKYDEKFAAAFAISETEPFTMTRLINKINEFKKEFDAEVAALKPAAPEAVSDSRYTIENGVVTFVDKEAERTITLGDMFPGKEGDVLLVDGTPAYWVPKKGQYFYENGRRALVRTGTKVEKADPAQYPWKEPKAPKKTEKLANKDEVLRYYAADLEKKIKKLYKGSWKDKDIPKDANGESLKVAQYQSVFKEILPQIKADFSTGLKGTNARFMSHKDIKPGHFMWDSLHWYSDKPRGAGLDLNGYGSEYERALLIEAFVNANYKALEKQMPKKAASKTA